MINQVDLILRNAILLTMDEEFHQYEPGAVAISGDSIVAAESEKLILKQFEAREVVDCQGKVLMPGLVNAHTHVPMALLRGLADDLRLDVWLLGYVMPVEREFVSPEFVKLGTRLGCAEQIRTGVTCFADMYYFEESVAEATAEAGLRAVCSQTVLKFPAPDAQSFEESLDAARNFIQRWVGHPLIVPSVAPHAAYTCTEEILKATAELAVEFDVPLHIHVAETAQEVEDSRELYDMPVVPYIKNFGILEAKVLAAHCVHIDLGEIVSLHRHNAGVAHCPSSNLKLASGFAPVSKMVAEGLKVGVGTDGPASNNDLDMFEEIRLAAFLAKSVSGDPTAIPAKTALTMATRLGAHALHIGDITGSIEPGKRADMILVDLTQPHNAPRFNRDRDGVYAQLVYAGKATDVTDVIVNGRWLMRERELQTLDDVDLMSQAQEYAKKIDVFLIEREKSIISKLVAIGGAMEEESFEVQAKARIPGAEPVLQAIELPQIEVLYRRHYHEFDTYFLFDDPQQGVLRYREDEFVDEHDRVSQVRYRLTLIGPTREAKFPSDVLLSRSRYLAPAVHSLRFYREYFKPNDEYFIEKHRWRWRVLYQGTEFYINLDRVDDPDLGYFLEVKSRTWSRSDAEYKAQLATALAEFLGASAEQKVAEDYLEMVKNERVA